MVIFDDDDKFSRSKWKPKNKERSAPVKIKNSNRSIKERRVDMYSHPGVSEVEYREDRKSKSVLSWLKFW